MTPQPQQQPHEWWCCEDCEHDGQGTCPVPESAINNVRDLKKFQTIVKITGCKHQKGTRSRPAPSPIDDEMVYRIIGTLALTEGFIPTAIRSEVMRLREELAESLRSTPTQHERA